MTATGRRPVTIDDLDRDELLRLIHGECIIYSEAALIWAQWEVACERWRAAWATYRRASEAGHAAWDAWIATGDAYDDALRARASARSKLANLERAHDAAKQRLTEARAAEARAKAKADRIERRRDMLIAWHEALRGGGHAA